MLRRNTGCFTMGITVLASDTDLEANVNKIKNNLMRIKLSAILSQTPRNLVEIVRVSTGISHLNLIILGLLKYQHS